MYSFKSMATSINTVVYQFGHSTASTAKPNHIASWFSVLNRKTKFQGKGIHVLRKKNELNVCMELRQRRNHESEKEVIHSSDHSMQDFNDVTEIKISKVEVRLAKKKIQRTTYLLAAMLSSLGISSMAVMAVYYRFSWKMEVGMEYWARWAHRALWHDSLWHMHESHHRAREGAFELNDVFAVMNAIPAIALLSYGFFNTGFVPGLCFGAGLGITVFGMAYMFVHDGLVHRRFPVGPIANVPYLQKVAAAHKLHHADKFDGVPYGLFLGHQELAEVGGLKELEEEINRRNK